MASLNVPSIAHLQPIGRDNSEQAELEASLEAALFSASCRAAFTWAVEQLEASKPKDLILEVLAANSVGREVLD